MELIRPVALFLLLFCGVAVGAEAERRQAEPCANGNTHQAGFCPAVLSSASCSATGATTGSCSATSDEADGTRYVCATSNNTALTGAEIEACSGGAAIAGASAAETGSNSIALSGLTTDAAHYGQIVNKSPEQWYSNRLVPSSFTPTGTGSSNETRINAVLAGRTIPFAFNYPADPVITDTSTCASVTSAAQFNACADDAGTRITVTSSFSGNVNIAADDIDVIVDNAYTITGNLNIASTTRNRIRWTGGNLAGSFDVARGTDVLIDDLHVTTPDSAFNAAGGDGRDRFAFINSTFERNGTGGINAWVFYTFNSASPALHDDYFIGNCLFTGTSPDDSLVRIQSMDGVVVVDSVFNPLGNALHGLRFHDGVSNAWVRDSWIRGDFKIDVIGSPANPSLPNLGSATLENVDVYNPGSLTFTSYVDDFPQGTTQNSGSVSNSTHHTQGTVGSFPTPTGFSNGGGNSQTFWNGSTVPDYSGVGAIR